MNATAYQRSRRETVPEWWTYETRSPPPPRWPWFALAAVALWAAGVACAWGL